MVNFERFVPVYDGEVAPNLDISLENSGIRAFFTPAEHGHTVCAAALGTHTGTGFANADHAYPVAASADHTGTRFATVAMHSKAGLVRTASSQDPSAFGSSVTAHTGSPLSGGVAA